MNGLHRIVAVGAVGVGTVLVSLFVFVVVSSIGYPFPLEWMEGSTLELAHRIQQGRSIYTAPSLEFVGYVYTPLYYWLVAPASSGFVPARLLSVASTLASAALLARFVHRELSDRRDARRWALVAAVCFIGAFSIVGYWYHLARVDGLHVLLLLSAAYLLRFGGSRRHDVVAGVVLSAAFLCKQSTLLVAAPLLMGAWAMRRRGTLVAAGVFVVIVATSTLVLDRMTEGWYGYYAFELPSRHAWIWERTITFWVGDLWRLAVGIGVGAIFLRRSLRRNRSVGTFYIGMATGFAITSYASRLHSGGWLNVLVPVVALVSLVFALGLAELATRRAALAAGLLLAQLVLLLYDPRPLVPTDADEAGAARFLDVVSGYEGDVWVPDYAPHPIDGRAHWLGTGMAGEDVWRASPHPTRAALLEDRRRAIAEQRFAAIVVHSDAHARERYPELFEHYELAFDIFEQSDAFQPVISFRMRPTRVYVPRARSR